MDLQTAQHQLRGVRAVVRLTEAFPSLAEDATVPGEILAGLASVFRQAATEGAALDTLPDPRNGEPVALADIDRDEGRWPIRMLRDVLPQLAGMSSLEEVQRRAQLRARDWLIYVTSIHERARKAYLYRRRAAEEDRRRDEAEDVPIVVELR